MNQLIHFNSSHSVPIENFHYKPCAVCDCDARFPAQLALMNCAQTSHSTGQATQATRQADQENRGLAFNWWALDVIHRIIVCFLLFLSWPKLLPQRMAPGPVELDRPAWALTFEPCWILGIHQYPSASWASGLSSSSQCHVFRLVIVTILDVSQFIEFNSSVSCFIPDQLSSNHAHG